MIDMHTHILPGIDDGATTQEEAIMLTEYLHRQQVTQAVCTPHFYPMEGTMENFLLNRSKAMEAVNHSKINLIAGSETYLHRYLFHYTDLKPLCIENTNYLLLEFPDMKVWNMEYMNDLDEIIGYYNINPIIAHIDRYRPLLRSKKLLKELKQKGCLLQLNVSALSDSGTRRRALKLIEEEYVDLLGSDCHDLSYRPPNIKEAQKIISHKLGENTWDKLMINAKKVIEPKTNLETPKVLESVTVIEPIKV